MSNHPADVGFDAAHGNHGKYLQLVTIEENENLPPPSRRRGCLKGVCILSQNVNWTAEGCQAKAHAVAQVCMVLQANFRRPTPPTRRSQVAARSLPIRRVARSAGGPAPPLTAPGAPQSSRGQSHR